MNENEIGQFKLSKDGKDHPQQTMAYDKDKTIWVNNLQMLGVVERRELCTEGWELVIDLQTAYGCFCADALNGEVVHLYGSGWMDHGFPFHDEKMTMETNPYETGKGAYAYLVGKTAKTFLKLAKQDLIPKFEDVYSGRFADLILPDFKKPIGE